MRPLKAGVTRFPARFRGETWAADTSLGATLHREAPGTNPVPLTDENLIAAALWAALCYLPRYGEGRPIGLAGRQGPISPASGSEPTRTNSTQSTFGIGSKAGRVILMLFAASS
jgi:hypothetical protein